MSPQGHIEHLRRQAREPWAQAGLRASLAAAEALENPVPDESGGWMHDYVCPQHFDFLRYDPASPHRHRCRAGHWVEGPAADAAWRVLRHRELADGAALLAQLGWAAERPELLEESAGILRRYAELYPRFQGRQSAQGWMLKGQVFQQALTEALWLVPVARAVWLLGPALGPADRAALAGLVEGSRQTLRAAQLELVHGLGKPHSNFNAWLIAALGAAALAQGDAAGLEACLEGELGLEYHLRRSILPDGFQWEGSPYYHNFVALAYSLLVEGLEAAGVRAYGRFREFLEPVWGVLPRTAWAGGDLIQRRDGSYWPNGPLCRELAQVLEIAWARTRDPCHADLLGRLYAGGVPPAWTALAYGRERPTAPARRPSSVVFRDSGLAVLRDHGPQGASDGGLEATLEFGPHGGEHGHLDKLSLHLAGWADDPGSPPYGAPIRREFYQQTAAHNTVVVDGRSQAECAGSLVEFGPGRAVARADAAHPGVRFRREVELRPGELLDTVELDSPDPHTYDWLFHGRGRLRLSHQPCDEALAEGGPYRFLRVWGRSRVEEGVWEATLEREGQTLRLSGWADAPLELLLCTAPGDDRAPWERRQVLLLRARGRSVRFHTRFSPGAGG